MYKIDDVRILYAHADEPAAAYYLAGWFMHVFGGEPHIYIARGVGPDYGHIARISFHGEGVEAWVELMDECSIEVRINGVEQKLVFPPKTEYGALREELSIVGKDPPPAIRAQASSVVEVTGYVDDVRPYVDRAAVFVCPLRILLPSSTTSSSASPENSLPPRFHNGRSQRIQEKTRSKGRVFFIPHLFRFPNPRSTPKRFSYPPVANPLPPASAALAAPPPGL